MASNSNICELSVQHRQIWLLNQSLIKSLPIMFKQLIFNKSLIKRFELCPIIPTNQSLRYCEGIFSFPQISLIPQITLSKLCHHTAAQRSELSVVRYALRNMSNSSGFCYQQQDYYSKRINYSDPTTPELIHFW